MSLNLVLPDRAQVDVLMSTRQAGCVSIYLATDPASDGRQERIEFGNLWRDARAQLESTGLDMRALEPYDVMVEDLLEDDAFWLHLARSAAIFIDSDGIWEYLLPTTLTSGFHVSDRFHLKPLLRSLTLPAAAYVLALSQNANRLIAVLPQGDPQELRVPDMPKDAVAAVGVPSISGRKPHGRVQGGEGQKMRMGQYCRAVDQALRPVLMGGDVPLILAAARPVADIYRQWNSYPHLAEPVIDGNPDATTDADLAARAREVLDQVNAQRLRSLHEVFEQRQADGRAVTDVADAARAATMGQIDTLFVDFDSVVPGSVDDLGEVVFEDVDDAVAYGIGDEIARRTWLAGGTVVAVRRQDVPGGGDVAAILRWSPGVA